MRLKELRLEKQLTQEQVALGIQTGQSNIGRWEREEVLPTSEFVIKLADFFGVSADYLLGRTDDLGAPVPGSTPQLTMEDRELLELFHRLGEQRKEDVFLYMRALAGADPYTASLKRKK